MGSDSKCRKVARVAINYGAIEVDGALCAHQWGNGNAGGSCTRETMHRSLI